MCDVFLERWDKYIPITPKNYPRVAKTRQCSTAAVNYCRQPWVFLDSSVNVEEEISTQPPGLHYENTCSSVKSTSNQDPLSQRHTHTNCSLTNMPQKLHKKIQSNLIGEKMQI